MDEQEFIRQTIVSLQSTLKSKGFRELSEEAAFVIAHIYKAVAQYRMDPGTIVGHVSDQLHEMWVADTTFEWWLYISPVLRWLAYNWSQGNKKDEDTIFAAFVAAMRHFVDVPPHDEQSAEAFYDRLR